jgi:hypothetical protein
MVTPNKGLQTPANNSDIGTWDVPMNANATAIDTALGGLTTINAAGASGGVALTLAQYTPCNIIITGALAGNVTYQLPAGVGGFWFVSNQTTGPYTLAFDSASGAVGVYIPQGANAAIVVDPVNGARLVNTIPTAASGPNGAIQYNSGGALTGDGDFYYLPGSSPALVLAGYLQVYSLQVINGVIFPLSIHGGAQTPSVQIGFAASGMTVNCQLSNVFLTTLTGSVTSAPVLSNPADGQTINWALAQDATGGRTMIWPSNFYWPAGQPGVLTTGGNGLDLLVATYFSLLGGGGWLATLLKNFAP